MNKIFNCVKKVAKVTGKGAVSFANAYADKVMERLSTACTFEERYSDLSIDELKKMYETLQGDERMACAALIGKKRRDQNL